MATGVHRHVDRRRRRDAADRVASDDVDRGEVLDRAVDLVQPPSEGNLGGPTEASLEARERACLILPRRVPPPRGTVNQLHSLGI